MHGVTCELRHLFFWKEPKVAPVFHLGLFIACPTHVTMTVVAYKEVKCTLVYLHDLSCSFSNISASHGLTQSRIV